MARIWVKHDVDIDGALNIDETKSVLSDFLGTQSKFTDRQIKQFFQQADCHNDTSRRDLNVGEHSTRSFAHFDVDLSRTIQSSQPL